MKIKRFLKACTLTVVLAAGALTPVTAFAQQESPASPAQAQPQDSGYTGTIAVPENQDLGEAGELAQYRSLAKVTIEEAIAAAREATGLSDAVAKAELGNENGFLVWEVVIGDQVVKVDSGNGEVLQVQQAGADEVADESGAGSDEEEAGEEDNQDQDEEEAGEEDNQHEDEEAAGEEDNQHGEEGGEDHE